MTISVTRNGLRCTLLVICVVTAVVGGTVGRSGGDGILAVRNGYLGVYTQVGGDVMDVGDTPASYSSNIAVTREAEKSNTLEDSPGNLLSNGSLALCTPQGCLGVSTTSNSFQAQLVPLDEMKTNIGGNGDGTLPLQWTYQTGLLKTTVQKGDDVHEQCLGPGVTSLSSNIHTYRLFLQDCPPDKSMGGRYQRYLIDSVTGHVQSLAPVFDLTSGKDISHDSPYCLTLEDSISTTKYGDGSSTSSNIGTPIVLMPCEDVDNMDTGSHQQFFQPQGTSEPFLFSLEPVWGDQDIVQIAYSVGLDISITNSPSPLSSLAGDPVMIRMNLGDSFLYSPISTRHPTGIASFGCLQHHGHKAGNPVRVSIMAPNAEHDHDLSYLMYSITVHIIGTVTQNGTMGTKVKRMKTLKTMLMMALIVFIAAYILVATFVNVACLILRKRIVAIEPLDVEFCPMGSIQSEEDEMYRDLGGEETLEKELEQEDE